MPKQTDRQTDIKTDKTVKQTVIQKNCLFYRQKNGQMDRKTKTERLANSQRQICRKLIIKKDRLTDRQLNPSYKVAAQQKNLPTEKADFSLLV